MCVEISKSAPEDYTNGCPELYFSNISNRDVLKIEESIISKGGIIDKIGNISTTNEIIEGIGGITFDDTPTKEKLIELLLLKLPHLVEVLTVDKSIEELLFYINLVGQITFSFSDSINLNIPCNIKKITLTNGVTFSDSYNIESPNDDRSLLSDSFNITINSPSIRRIIFK